MRIALDWDGTVTLDEPLWQEFVASARARGHEVVILTKRYPSEAVALEGVDRVIYCARQSKMRKLNELDIRIDVFIDNDPSDLFR